MGETYPPAAAWGAQGASPLQPELLYICPGHFSSVTESSGHTIYTHLSHMLALWKVNVSQCSDARRDIKKFSAKLFFTVFSGSSAQSHGHAANDTGIVRSHKDDSHRPGGFPYPLDVITWCALPFSPSAGLKRQPEHFLSNGSGEALRLAESSHG